MTALAAEGEIVYAISSSQTFGEIRDVPFLAYQNGSSQQQQKSPESDGTIAWLNEKHC